MIENILKARVLTYFFLSTIISFSQETRNVVLQDHWLDTNIILGVEDHRLSDVWGFDYNGQNYAVVGTNEGIELFMVTTNSMEFVDKASGAFSGVTVVHRDMKTYRNYLYAVCDEGTSTLQIFDLSFLPDSLHKVYDSNAFFDVCHNIYIDTAKAKLYAAGPNNAGMKVLDLSTPDNPTLLNDFTNVTYVHDCFVVNDTAFLNCGIDGLQVYDFSSPTPIQIGVLDFYTDQGYNHSGWLSPDRSKYCFIDETEGTKIKLCEIGELANIKVDALYGTQDFQDYMPHNIQMTNNLAFIAYYNEGFRIFDLSKSPVEQIAFYDTFEEETAYKLNGAWGVHIFPESDQILISDRQTGLYLFSFPIQLFDHGISGTTITNTPFIDENSYLIPRADFAEDNLTFSIASLNGTIVYNQESYLNWMNIPLQLAPGGYVFGIYDSNGDMLQSGKFIKAN